MSLPVVAFTLGDPAGVGPEIMARALGDPELYRICIPVVIGDLRIVERALRLVGTAPPLFAIHQVERSLLTAQRAYVVDLRNLAPEGFAVGQVSEAAGRAAGQWIEAAIRLAMDGQVDAVVTNPIHKESFRLGGYGDRFPGHTEMFAELTNAEQFCMMLVCGGLRICHVSLHVALRDAIDIWIHRERILEVITLAHEACLQVDGAPPRIGVAALNPHGGEGGLFGDEEQREIIPAIVQAREAGFTVDGPIPADTLFVKAKAGVYDIVVAMYHDQGHIAAKMLGFDYNQGEDRWTVEGVNVTLGLPIIRTSVDHGTAFDKAGKGTASYHSLMDATRYAVALVPKR